jgi:osmotically inducible protein OsmC
LAGDHAPRSEVAALSVRVIRRAEVSWQGNVPEGGGRIALGSGAYAGPFTLRARIEDVERSTNPEELIAAASAGCFTMSLADLLSNEGHPPADLQTSARIRLEQTDEGFRITRLELQTAGEVPGVDAKRFLAMAERARATCPVSLALAGVEITVEATKIES